MKLQAARAGDAGHADETATAHNRRPLLWVACKPRIIREMPAYDLARLQLTVIPKVLPPETYVRPALSEFLTKAAARL